MKEKGIGMVVNFIVRMIFGVTMIFFVNQFLEIKEISAAVGYNPVSFLTSGFLGLPGVALLYGIILWKRI